jgi:hypothetical protein
MPDDSPTIGLRVVESLSAVVAEQWDACALAPGSAGNPFLSHRFLKALEDSKSVGRRTGRAAARRPQARSCAARARHGAETGLGGEGRGLSTREALAEAVAALKQTIQQDDTLWVFVLGHAHYDGRYSWLNLPGPDLHQIEFGGLFADVRCHEQVFFMTTAASGFFIKPLAQPGRIVISATEPDREVNETMFPHKLALALAEPPPFLEFDMDLDGRLTLLDAYLWSARETAAAYLSDMLLATEHAQLDDNGDGRGTEVQAQFLSEELGGKRKAGREAPLIQTGDGAATRRVLLAYPPAPPAPEPE